jgi:hypothetical protein
MAYNKHPYGLHETMQLRLHDRLAMESPGSIGDVEHIDIASGRDSQGVLLLRVPFHRMKRFLAFGG